MAVGLNASTKLVIPTNSGEVAFTVATPTSSVQVPRRGDRLWFFGQTRIHVVRGIDNFCVLTVSYRSIPQTSLFYE